MEGLLHEIGLIYITNKLHHRKCFVRILFTRCKTLEKLEENCELRGTDYVQGQISEHIFKDKLKLLCLLSIGFKNWVISSDNYNRDLQIRLRLRVRVRLLSARGLGLSCRRHRCCRHQLATKIFLRVRSYNILSVAGMFSRQTTQDATKSPKHCETSCTDHFTVYPRV